MPGDGITAVFGANDVIAVSVYCGGKASGYSRGGADRTDTGADMLHSVQRVLLSPEVFTGAACVMVGAAARRGRAT